VKAVIVAVLALLGLIHVSVPALSLPAPVPVCFAMAGILFTLVFMVAGTLRRDGLFPVWLRVTT
jgi:hypothetical protein